MWIALLYLTFGIFSLIFGLFVFKQRRTIYAWLTVTGKMLERKVDVSPGGRGGRMGPPAYRYEALVKYRYQVEGRDYTNDKLYRVGWVTSTRPNRQKLLDTLPDDPLVHYNPEDPQDSCLLLLSKGWGYFGIIFGGIVALTALLYLVVTLVDR